MATNLFVVSILAKLTLSSKDYTDCRWFGNQTNAPLFPIDVCTAHSHESELDNLWLYSTKLQCDDGGELTQFEWNNTDCSGDPYNSNNYRKEDGYYFHCDAPTSCPYTKLILRDLRDLGNDTTNIHNEHLCVFDNNAYHEVALVTNICIDFIAEYNTSFFVDCDARTVTYTAYNDTECTSRRTDDTYFEVKEGCEDEFGFNAYIQIAECDDANYHPPFTPPHKPLETTTGTPSHKPLETTTGTPSHKPLETTTGTPSHKPLKTTTGTPSHKPVHTQSATLTATRNRLHNTTASPVDNHQTIIFCLIVALVIMGLVIAIILILIKRKSESEVNKMNIDDQPFNVDFQSIGDGDVEPQDTQQITTQGQDIEEISIIDID